MIDRNIELLVSPVADETQLRRFVDDAVQSHPVVDIHTHLFPPDFGNLCLWGIDELVTYHYLVAELFRSSSIAPAEFWNLSKRRQADLIWKTLFVDNTPLSEATRGVVTAMSALGLDPAANDLSEARRYFASQNLSEHLERVLKIANVKDVVMTNDPFDPAEAAVWASPEPLYPRFHPALRLDALFNGSSRNVAETRRFLDTCIDRIHPLYFAASFPPDFVYHGDSTGARLLREA